MYRSSPLQRMVSTCHGQRRILKKQPPVAKYIRQAVESGTYPPEEDEKLQEQAQKKAPYGSNFRDLPIEYEILTLYPPIPPPPRLPKKQRGLRKKESHVPTEKLVNDFLKRQEQAQHYDITEEEYYNKLLGIPPPKSTTAMGRKSAVLNKAYAFALRQYEIMRQDDTITQEESIDMVNKLLEQEHYDQRYSSRKTMGELQKWRKTANSNTLKSDARNTSFASDITNDATTDKDDDRFHDTFSYPSILHSKPRAIEGMAVWSRRLQAVPYREWTIGATTALDHWIARSILQLEEDTWQELLEGETSSVVSQGADIIAVRQSLFPETVLHGARQEEIMIEEEEDIMTSQDKSIDELLASLGGFDDDYEDTKESDASKFWPSSSVVEEDDLDGKVAGLVNELQSWRQKNVESPYEQWSASEKDDFAVRVYCVVWCL